MSVAHDHFQRAVALASAPYTAEQWFSLTPVERSAAIYHQLRKLDAETVRWRTTRGRLPAPPRFPPQLEPVQRTETGILGAA
jgi:hypothetical protein